MFSFFKQKPNATLKERFVWRFLPITDKIRKQPMLFCINPGRSGSKYLAELLQTAKDVRAYHEPRPAMIGPYLEMTNKWPLKKTKKKRMIKAKAVAAIVKSWPSSFVYAETNHMFIKTFYDIILENFKNVTVICLKRDPAAVLKSFMDLGYFTNRNANWPAWMSSDAGATSVFAGYTQSENMDKVDRAIWYIADIQARGERIMREYPNVKFVEQHVEKLNKLSYVSAFFSNLNLTMTVDTEKSIGQKQNIKSHFKERNRCTSLEYYRKRIHSYNKKCDEAGSKSRVLWC